MFKISKKKHLEMILENIPAHPNPKVNLEQYSTSATIAADLLWNAWSIGDIENKNILDLGCGTGILAMGSLLMGAKSVLGLDIDDESIDLAKETISNIENKYNDILSNLNFLVADVNSFNGINEFLSSDCSFDKLFINGNSNNNLGNFINNINNNNIADNNTINNNYIVNNDKNYKEDMNNLVSFKYDTLIQNPPFGSQERGERGADRKFMEFAMNSAKIIYSFHMANAEEFVIDYFNSLGGDVTHKLVYKFKIPKLYDFHTNESKDVKIVVLRVENHNF